MVADIHIGNNLYGALAYNQEKIDCGKGQILETNRIFVPADGQFRIGECMRDFERTMPPQITTTRGIVHISLNPHPEDKLTDDKLADIGREYMERLGFGEQPYMIFKHEDIDRHHLHIVSTRVRSDGTLISDKKDFERSRKITDDLEQKYDLHPKDQRQGEAWQLAPVDATAGELKKQVGNIVKHLSVTYKFHSLPGYRALLSLYNVGVEKVEGENKGHRYTGLVYSALDGEGNRVGRPLKSSLFGKQYGIGALEQTMAKSEEEIKTKGIPDSTRATVAASLTGSDTGNEFQAKLREKEVDLVLRYGNGGRLFGATFIDHNTRTVLNGSALGKDFAANALGARFPDLSTESRENRLPIQSPTRNAQTTPVRETAARSGLTPAVDPQNETANKPLRPTVQPAPDNHRLVTQPAASVLPREDRRPTIHSTHDENHPQLIKDSSGDDLSVGSLFSILTPEQGQYDENQPLPAHRRKKKKRKYGRQM